MTVIDKIKDHYENKKFARITRKVSDDWEEISRGYIVDYFVDFIILQESEDFKMLGFNIFPINQIRKIRFNKHDGFYDKIMSWENEKANIVLKTKVDLTNWTSIFKTFQKLKKNVVVECENSEINSFTIGSIKRITDKSVYIQYFDAEGFLDKKLTKVEFKNITKIMFDDRYIDIFSKYIRLRKPKTSFPKTRQN